MQERKTKIVLDADVIIHFSKGGRLSILPKIFPEFGFLVLDVVKRELPVLVLPELQKMIERDKSLAEELFGKSPGEIKEYARLTSSCGPGLGKGESACMVYCLYHKDVLGSSNLRDVREYCEEKGITYLTTIDFLHYAIRRKVMTKEEAEEFVRQVISMGSKLPQVDFATYVCTKI